MNTISATILSLCAVATATLTPLPADAADYLAVLGNVSQDDQKWAARGWACLALKLGPDDRLLTFDRNAHLVDETKRGGFLTNHERAVAAKLPAIGKALAGSGGGMSVPQLLEVLGHDHMREAGGPYSVVVVADPRYHNEADPGASLLPWAFPNPALCRAGREYGALAAGGRGSLRGSSVFFVAPRMGSTAWNDGMRSAVAAWVEAMGGRLLLFGSDPAALQTALASPPDPIRAPAAEGKPAIVAAPGDATAPAVTREPSSERDSFFQQRATDRFDSSAVGKIVVGITWDGPVDVDLHVQLGDDQAGHAYFSHKIGRLGNAVATLDNDLRSAHAAGSWEKVLVTNPPASGPVRAWVRLYSGAGPVTVRWRVTHIDAQDNRMIRDGTCSLASTGSDAPIPIGAAQ